MRQCNHALVSEVIQAASWHWGLYGRTVVGPSVGGAVGRLLGSADGWVLGKVVGCVVGEVVGCSVGGTEGSATERNRTRNPRQVRVSGVSLRV
jgi:outer membrane lipoprotein SlyB